MAERLVSWKAVANFAAVAREAKKTEKALDSLQRKQEAFNASQGPNLAGASNARGVDGIKAVTAATDKATSASNKLASAQAKQVAAARETERAARSASTGLNTLAQAQSDVEKTSQAVARGGRSVASAAGDIDKGARRANVSLRETSRVVGDAAVRMREYRRETESAVPAITRLNASLKNAMPNFDRNSVAAGRLGNSLRALAIPLVITGINLLASTLSPLAAGFIGLAGAIAPAAGLLGTLPGLLTAVVGSAGTLVAGFAGIGGAIKAYGQQQKAAAKQAKTAATAQIGDAKKQESAVKRVAAAQRAQADNAEQSARAIANAERTVSDAQKNAVSAQRAIGDARNEARRQIEDLINAEKDYALQVEGSSLSVEEAKLRLQRTLNDPGSTDLERRQAGLAVREAEARLGDVKKASAQNDKDLKTAQRKGVEGSDQVIQAKQNEAEANQRVADAQQSLVDANKAAAQSSADAAESLADASQAAAEVGAASAAAADQTDVFAEAMSKLTPEAQAVVRQLLSMKPLIDQIRATAQRGLMPGFLVFLQSAVKLFAPFNRFIDRASKSFGEFFARVGRAMSTRTAIKQWGTVLGDTNDVIDIFIDAAFNIAVVIARITRAGAPLTKWLFRTVEGWTATWEAMTAGEAGQRKLTKFFGQARKSADLLGRIIGNLVGVLYEIGRATAGTGEWILESFNAMIEGWREFTGSVRGQNVLREWGEKSRPVLSQLAGLIGDLVHGILDLGSRTDIAPIIQQIRDELVPALLKVMGLFTGETASRIVSLLSHVGEIIAAIAGSDTGGLLAIITFLDKLAGGLSYIVNNVPGVADAIGIMIASFLALKALQFVGSPFLKIFDTIAKGAGNAATKTDAAAKALATDAGATRAAPGATTSGRGAARKAQRAVEKDKAADKAAGGTGARRAAGKATKGGAGVAKRAAPEAVKEAPKALGAIARGAKGIASAFAPVLAILGGFASLIVGVVILAFLEFLGVLKLVDVISHKVFGKGIWEVGVANVKAVGEALKAFGIAALDIFKRVGGAIATFFGPAIEFIGRVFARIGYTVQTGVAIIQRILQIAATLIYIAFIKPFIDTALAIAQHWDQIKAFFAAGIAAVLKVLQDLWAGIRVAIVDPVVAAGLDVWEGLKAIGRFFRDAFIGFINLVRRIWAGFVDVVLKPVAAVLVGIGRWIASVWDKFRAFIQPLLDWIARTFGPIVEVLAKPFRLALDKIGGFLNQIKTKIDGWIETIKKAIAPIGDAFKLAFAKIKAAVSDPMDFIVNKVINPGLIDPFNGLMDKLNMPGAKVDRIAWSPPPLKEGGRVPGGKQATRDNRLAVDRKGNPVAKVEPGEYVVPRSMSYLFPALEEVRQGKHGRGRGTGHGYKTGGAVPSADVGALSILNPVPGRYTTYPGHSENAVDFPVPTGTTVRAPLSGQITDEKSWNYSYGHHMRLDAGSTEFLFAHLLDFLVPNGARVNRGDPIALTNNTGHSTGPHLHFGMNKSGSWVNPAPYLSGKLLDNQTLQGAAQSVTPAPDPLARFLDIVTAPFKALLGKIPGGGMGRDLAKAGALKLASVLTGRGQKVGETSDATPPGEGVGRWGPMVLRALARVGLPASQQDIWLTQIATESGGNPSAIQGNIGDINNKTGDIAKGLLQVIGATFAAYRDRDLPDDRLNPWANMVAAMRYAKARYGSSIENVIGHGHGYARGTMGASPGWRLVGENGPEIVRFKGGEQVRNRQQISDGNLPGYSAGGYLRGVAPGAKGNWVRALNSQLMNGYGNSFSGGLLSTLKKRDGVVNRYNSYNLDNRLRDKVVKFLKAQGTKDFPNSLAWLAGKIGIDPNRLWRGGAEIEAQAKRAKVNGAAIGQFNKARSSWGDNRKTWVKSLEGVLGLPQDGLWGGEIAGPLRHVLAHAFKWPMGTHGHSIVSPRPWSPVTDAEKAIYEQQRANALNKEFDGLITKFTSWNLPSVVRKLTDLGPADGLSLGRSLAKNQGFAKSYDAELKKAYDRDDAKTNPNNPEARIQLFIKTVAGGTTASPVGLQGVSKVLELSEDSTVPIYDSLKGRKAWTDIAANKRARLENDVRLFRNLFTKMRLGGQVGRSGNGDRVPILGEPGEFMVRRLAAQALEADFGRGTMAGINNYDRTRRMANGGYAMAGLSQPSFSGVRTSFSGVRSAPVGEAKHVTNNFNTTVNNPTLEDGAVSVQKRVTRIARLGLLDGDTR